MNGKKLYRSDENKMLAGVCGCIAISINKHKAVNK